MTQNASIRVITAASAALSTGAAKYRDQFAVGHFGDGIDLDAETTKGKPRFEIREEETGKREFTLTLIERANNGKVTPHRSVRVGIYGRMLDKQVANETPQAEEPAVEAEAELADA